MKGIEILKKIEQAGTAEGKPGRPVKIVDCGKTSESKIPDAVGKEKGNPTVVMGTIARIS